ncbi:MAG TPA: hypothetical protein VFD73_05435, partial [Gemmatimonadales bacterium]|nr:hypothetical protein [Gemmatimonadales bacterium]
MRVRRRLFTGFLLAVAGLAPASAKADPTPAWAIQSIAAPTNFAPGDESGSDRYFAFITNSGGKATDRSPITITDTLPPGVKVKRIILKSPRGETEIGNAPVCEAEESGGVATASCEVTEAVDPPREPALLYPGNQLLFEIRVKTPASASGTLVNRVEVAGGGAEPVSREIENPASEEEAHIGFEEFHAGLVGADGKPARGAASHPYQYVTSFAVNTVPSVKEGDNFIPAEGDLKDVEVALPAGLAGNPTAIGECTPEKFTNVHTGHTKLGQSPIGVNECPVDTAVG